MTSTPSDNHNDLLSQLAHACSEKNELPHFLLEDIPVKIYFKDTQSRFIRVSRAMAKFLGASDASEILGKTDFDFFAAGHAQEAFDDEQQMMLTGEAIIGKVEKETLANGRHHWAITTKMPLRAPGGEIIGTCGISKDFTPFKETQDALAHSNKELGQVTNMIVHDLRSPLQVIGGFSHLIAEHLIEKGDELGRNYVARIMEAKERMHHMIAELLTQSRTALQEVDKEEVDLGAMARSVIDELRQGAPQRRVECTIAGSPKAFANPVLIRTVLENLLGNAWKYTSQRERARIEFGTLPGETNVFFIKDNGVGFSMENAHKVFEIWQRLHDGTNFSGTGVGLASVERIIRKHGGSTWAEAAVDKGATFYFQLPAYEPGGSRPPRKRNRRLAKKEAPGFSKSLNIDNMEELFSFMLEEIPVKIYFKDTQSRFIRVSRSMAGFLGASDTSEIIGKTDFDFFTAGHAQEAFDDEQLIMRTGEPIIGKVENETLPNGQNQWAITTKMPLRTAAGEIIGTCGISKDFTEQKALERALARTNTELARRKEQLQLAIAALHGANLNIQAIQQQLIETRKSEAIGELACKVANDLHSPLNILESDLDRLGKLPAVSGDASYMTIIENMTMAIRNANDAVNSIRDDALKSNTDTDSGDLEKVIRRTLEVLDNEERWLVLEKLPEDVVQGYIDRVSDR